MDEITGEQLLDYVAPCSLLCYSCPGFTRGIVPELSGKLDNYLEGLYEHTLNNAPEEYKSRAEMLKQFKDTLSHMAKPRCNGCRHNPNPGSCIPGCFLLECTREHGVDFCGECSEFPCDKVDTSLFKTTVYNRWMSGSNRIREVGIEQFFEEEKDKSHYIDFVRDDS